MTKGSDMLPLLWNIPYQRNPFFTGREEVLSDLHRSLSAENTVALADPQGITGLGGIGKTQTALEYAYRYGSEYSAVFWVYAHSTQMLLPSLTDIAQMLKLPECHEQNQFAIADAVLRWFRLHSGWLLIFDNMDDLSIAEPFLPKGGPGHILFTTRVHALGGLAQRVDVQTMEPDTGALLLLRRAALLPLRESLEIASSDDRNRAREIAQALDGLPLALDQAGAYIKETPCSLSDYLARYLTRRQEVLQKRGSFDLDYPASVATTWSLSFEKVQRTNPAAAELLHFCAFLAPDAIPEEVLVGGAPYLASPLQHVIADKVLFDQALAALLAYSFVGRSADNEMLSIHRLVQAVLQDTIHAEKKKRWMECVVLTVNSTFPSGDFATWAACERITPHALIGAGWIKQEEMISPEAIRLLNQAGYYLEKRGQYAEAEPLYVQALAICEPQRGAEHPDTATILNNLALLYSDQGKHTQAEPLYRRALAIREAQLGTQHPETIQCFSNLAGCYKDLGRYAKAESMYQRALAITEQQKGEHLDTATCLNNLADLYRSLEKYAEAEPLYVRAVAIYEQQLGTEHPDAATNLNNLAVFYKDQGKYAEAESLYQRILATREQLLGMNHPDTAMSLNNLAALYQEQGKYADAEPLYQRALAIREQQLGVDHPDTAQSVNNLGNLSRIQRKYTEAECLLKRALTIREQQLGSEHPQTATSLNNLALLYQLQRRYAEAELLLCRAFTVYERQFGPGHSSTALVLNNLADLYQQQGNFVKAEALFKHALSIYEQQLGTQHPSTATILYNLALLYQNQGQYARAEPLYQRAIAIFKLALRQEHPTTQTIQENYLHLLQMMEPSTRTEP